jgi:serine/threonine protein kinase
MPVTPQTAVSKILLIDEIRQIIRGILEHIRNGKRVQQENLQLKEQRRFSLDPSEYFTFLEHFDYVARDRTDRALIVTEKGKCVVDQKMPLELEKELEKYFAKRAKDNPESIDLSESGEEEAAEKSEVSFLKAENKHTLMYDRCETIGSGGIGTVFRARNVYLPSDVAIKEIIELFSFFNFLQRSEIVRHFREAVGQMALLNHPMIVKILDQDMEVTHPFFVMEYLPGGNLKKRMEKGPMSVDQVMLVFNQVCYALREAHHEKVIHGDMKPENILFDSQGNVRVTDFGIHRLLESDSDRPIPHIVTGTLDYLSPEQRRQEKNLSPQTDIYALGVVLYEMLTGILPGRRAPMPSAINPKAPKELDALFDAMTRDKIEERPSDIDAVLDDFYRLISDGRFLKKGVLLLHSPLSPEA